MEYLFLVLGESEEHLWKHEEPFRSNTSLRQPHLQERQQGHLALFVPRLWTHAGKYTHARTHTTMGSELSSKNINKNTEMDQLSLGIITQQCITLYLLDSENHYLNGLSCFSDQHDFFCCCWVVLFTAGVQNFCLPNLAVRLFTQTLLTHAYNVL